MRMVTPFVEGGRGFIGVFLQFGHVIWLVTSAEGKHAIVILYEG